MKQKVKKDNKKNKIFKDKTSVKIFSLSFAITILFLFATYSVVVVKNKCSYLPTDFYKIKIDEESEYFDSFNNLSELNEKIIPMFLPKVYFAQQFVYAVENYIS